MAIAAVTILFPSFSCAMEMWQGPLEVLCQEKDLVLVVRFLGADDLPEKERSAYEKANPQGSLVKEHTVLKRIRFEIVEVVRNNTTERLGKNFTALAYYEKPDSETTIVCPRISLSFEEKSSYILLLGRDDKKKDYVISPSHQLTMTASPEELAKVRKAAHPEKWKWSKPQGGLSAAINTDSYNTEGGGTGVWVIMAIRNESKKEISYVPAEGQAVIEGLDSKGKRVLSQGEEREQERARENPRPATQPANKIKAEPPVKIAPGQILFVQHTFYNFSTGKGTLQATWEVPKAADPSLWYGKVQTEVVHVERKKD